MLPSGNLRANKPQNRRTALGRQLHHRLRRQGPAQRESKMRQIIHMAPVLSDMPKAPAIDLALLVTGRKRTATAHAWPEVSLALDGTLIGNEAAKASGVVWWWSDWWWSVRRSEPARCSQKLLGNRKTCRCPWAATRLVQKGWRCRAFWAIERLLRSRAIACLKCFSQALDAEVPGGTLDVEENEEWR